MKTEHRAEMTANIEEELTQQDAELGTLLAAVRNQLKAVPRLPASALSSHFEALARSIIYQQLSGRAAGAVFNKFKKGVGGEIKPDAVAVCSAQALRAFGLSGSKCRYLLALTSAVREQRVNLEQLDELNDAGIVQVLTCLDGIGEWTAQMFLMFRLRRPDVLPTTDLGIRKGFALLGGADSLPAPSEIAERGQIWAPHRSIVSLYLWRAVDIGYRATGAAS